MVANAEPIVEGVGDYYMSLVFFRKASLARLCHQYGVVPDGVCKVTVTFLREDLTRENCNDKLHSRGDDQSDIFDCSDADHQW